PCRREQESECCERDQRELQAQEDDVGRLSDTGNCRVHRIEERPSADEECRGRQGALRPRREVCPHGGYDSDGPPGSPRTEGDETKSVERGCHGESRRSSEASSQGENDFGDLCRNRGSPNFQSPPTRSNADDHSPGSGYDPSGRCAERRGQQRRTLALLTRPLLKLA